MLLHIFSHNIIIIFLNNIIIYPEDLSSNLFIIFTHHKISTVGIMAKFVKHLSWIIYPDKDLNLMEWMLHNYSMITLCMRQSVRGGGALKCIYLCLKKPLIDHQRVTQHAVRLLYFHIDLWKALGFSLWTIWGQVDIPFFFAACHLHHNNKIWNYQIWFYLFKYAINGCTLKDICLLWL